MTDGQFYSSAAETKLCFLGNRPEITRGHRSSRSGFKRRSIEGAGHIGADGLRNVRAVLLLDGPLGDATPMVDLMKTVMPGVDKVVALGIANPDRLGIIYERKLL